MQLIIVFTVKYVVKYTETHIKKGNFVRVSNYQTR